MLPVKAVLDVVDDVELEDAEVEVVDEDEDVTTVPASPSWRPPGVKNVRAADAGTATNSW